MNSDTLIESSPAKDGDKNACSYIKKDVESDLRRLLNPFYNQDVIWGLPMSWKDELMYYHKRMIPAAQYLVPKEEIESWLFPRVHTDKSVTNIGIPFHDEERIEVAVDWWYSLFRINANIKKMDRDRRLQALADMIKRYLSFLDVAGQSFEIVIDPRVLDESTIAVYQNRFQSTGGPLPLYRILLLDIDNPAVLLWQDDENLCGFDIFQMNSDFYLQVRFIHSILVFIEETSFIKNADILLLLL